MVDRIGVTQPTCRTSPTPYIIYTGRWMAQWQTSDSLVNLGEFDSLHRRFFCSPSVRLICIRSVEIIRYPSISWLNGVMTSRLGNVTLNWIVSARVDWKSDPFCTDFINILYVRMLMCVSSPYFSRSRASLVLQLMRRKSGNGLLRCFLVCNHHR